MIQCSRYAEKEVHLQSCGVRTFVPELVPDPPEYERERGTEEGQAGEERSCTLNRQSFVHLKGEERL
jgi:hypothetical protein